MRIFIIYYLFNITFSIAQQKYLTKKISTDSTIETFKYFLRNDSIIKEGAYSLYFQKAKTILKGFYKNGLKNGYWSYGYSEKNKTYDGYYSHGKKSGIWTFYFKVFYYSDEIKRRETKIDYTLKKVIFNSLIEDSTIYIEIKKGFDFAFNLRPELRTIVNKINICNSYHCKNIGIVGQVSNQWVRSEQLQNIANDQELITLLKHPNYVVKAYVFDLLVLKRNNIIFDYYVENINDTTKFWTYCGCEVGKEKFNSRLFYSLPKKLRNMLPVKQKHENSYKVLGKDLLLLNEYIERNHKNLNDTLNNLKFNY